MKNKRKNRYFLLEIGGALCMLGLWWLLAYIVRTSNPKRGAIILPSPADVIRDIPTFATFRLSAKGQPDLWIAAQVIFEHMLISSARLFSGMAIGIALGVFIGLLLATYPRIRKIVGPVIMFLRTIPIMSLVPLFLLWFAGREEGNIIYIVFAVFCMVVVNTVEAAKNVPTVYVNYARTLGASRWRIIRTVTLPYIIPELLGGISVVVGLGWAIVLAAEYLAAQAGLGFMLLASERYLYTSKMIFLVLLLTVLAVLINNGVLRIGRYLTRWKPRVSEKRMSDKL